MGLGEKETGKKFREGEQSEKLCLKPSILILKNNKSLARNILKRVIMRNWPY